MIGPTDLLHPSTAPHFKTFQAFLICCPERIYIYKESKVIPLQARCGPEGGEWSAARPGRTLPPGKTRYPFYRMLCGPQGRSGKAENIVPTGIRSRTIQRVVSRCTDWATRSTNRYSNTTYLLVITFVSILGSQNVHCYLMYHRYRSMISLMMTLWVETCRNIYKW